MIKQIKNNLETNQLNQMYKIKFKQLEKEKNH